MGVPSDLIRGSLRLSMGRTTTAAEVDRAADLVAASVERVRAAAQPAAADAAPAPAGA
jgi:cysteine sulfinate desulfinase/cysteine desulfurase-like protein